MAGVLERSDEPVAPGDQASPPVRLGHQPGLDGLRGVAVFGVLCFHQGFDWASGGFLGVSAFFTLSGFLITTVLLASAAQPTGPRLRSFWARRARRLLPAAWAVILAVVLADLAGVGLGTLDPAEPLAALAQVSNWQAIAADRSYADLFSAPSPLLHYWSLSIEQQFYIVFPFALIAGMATKRGGAITMVVVAGLIAVSTIAMAMLGPGDRSYYGTGTRLAEILVGVLAALVLARWRSFTIDRFAPFLRWAGPLAGLVLLAMWSTATVTSTALTRGGFLAHAVLTLVVVGAAMCNGPIRSLLSARPLVGLGSISYGVYLVHWPLYLLLDADRTGLDGVPLFAVRVGASLVVAAISYVVLEKPILRGRRSVAWMTRPVFAVAVVVAIVVASLALDGGQDELTEARDLLADDPGAAADQATEEAAAFEGDLPSSPNADPSLLVPAVPGELLHVTVMGDSTAVFVGGGLNQWAFENPESGLTPSIDAWFACSVVRDTEIHYRVGRPTTGAPECQNRDTEWTAAIAATDPDVVVLMMGPHDVGNHLVAGSDGFTHVGRPDFDALLADEFRSATQLVLDAGVPVIWVTAPQIDVGRDVVPPVVEPASEDARIDRYNEILTTVVDELADAGEPVDVVDLEGYLATTPGGPEDPALRPDGVHFTFGTAAVVAEAWLAPEIVVTGRRLVDG